MKPNFRCGIRKAIDELAGELNLPNEKSMQDWPIEVMITSDIEKYIEHYEKLTNEDKKFVLMEGILVVTEYQPTEELFVKNWDRVRQFLEKDFTIHEYTIYYWACFEIENIEDCWKLTPLMRQLWSDNAKLEN